MPLVPIAALAARTPVLAGADQRTFIDLDWLLRPVYGYAKQGASFGHTTVSGKQVLRKGLSPLATTISTPIAVPVVAGPSLPPRPTSPTEATQSYDHQPRRPPETINAEAHPRIQA